MRLENDHRDAARTPIGQPPTRRDEIIRHSAELFDRKGYHKTSMNDVAVAVGLQKPTLYHYVAGKDEILFWIHQEFIDVLLERQRRRARAGLSSTHCLLQVMTDLLELVETRPGHVRTFFEHYRELPGDRQEEIRLKSREYRQMVEDVIQQGITVGELRSVDPGMAALALFGMCNWAYQWFDSSGTFSGREIAYLFNEILLVGISNTGPAGREVASEEGTT